MKPESSSKHLRYNAVLGMICLGLLLLGCFVVLKPFITIFVWGLVLAYTLWPLQRRFSQWFRGHNTLAAVAVSLLVFVAIGTPMTFIVINLAEDSHNLGTTTRKWYESVPEEPPAWLAKMPFISKEATAYWHDFAADRRKWLNSFDQGAEQRQSSKPKRSNSDEKTSVSPEPDSSSLNVSGISDNLKQSRLFDRLASQLGQFAASSRDFLLSTTKQFLQSLLQLIFSIILAFLLLRRGHDLGEKLLTAVRKLSGEQGIKLLKVAGGTTQGVVYGILGTALAQGTLAGIGFAMAGVPSAILLGAATFFLSALPIGPPLVWIPATLWLFSEGHTGWGIFLLIWGIFAISGVDNILKPYLISQGSKTPMTLVFCGILGGAFTFGLIGVFLGPVLLAVGYRMIGDWLKEA